MAKKISKDGPLASASPLTCNDCGENLGIATDKHGAWRLKDGQSVHHCDGSTVAFGAKNIGPHHTLTPWPPCWRCQQPLGCPKCVSCTPDEVLCEACLVWGTLAAFLQHGPITNDLHQLRKRGGKRAPTVEDYPPLMRAQYAATEDRVFESLALSPADTNHARQMMDVFSAAIPERYAAAILQRWQGDRPPGRAKSRPDN